MQYWNVAQLHEWHSRFLDEPQDDVFMHIVLFGGDRLSKSSGAVVEVACDGSVIGVASWSLTGDSIDGPEIIGTWVHPSFRRRGIGRRLWRAAEEEVRRRVGGGARVGSVAVTPAGAALLRSIQRE